jgi:hypothetical protein
MFWRYRVQFSAKKGLKFLIQYLEMRFPLLYRAFSTILLGL